MAQNNIDRIREAEEQAAHIREDGAEKARAYIAEVQAREERRYEEAVKGARLMAQDILRQAKETSDKELEQLASRREAELADFRRDAEGKLDTAATHIAERIVE